MSHRQFISGQTTNTIVNMRAIDHDSKRMKVQAEANQTMTMDNFYAIVSIALSLAVAVGASVFESYPVLLGLTITYVLSIMIVYYAIARTGATVGVTAEHINQQGHRICYIALVIWYMHSAVYFFADVHMDIGLFSDFFLSGLILGGVFIVWLLNRCSFTDLHKAPPLLTFAFCMLMQSTCLLPARYNNAIFQTPLINLARCIILWINYFLYVTLYPPYQKHYREKNGALIAYVYILYILFIHPFLLLPTGGLQMLVLGCMWLVRWWFSSGSNDNTSISSSSGSGGGNVIDFELVIDDSSATPPDEIEDEDYEDEGEDNGSSSSNNNSKLDIEPSQLQTDDR